MRHSTVSQSSTRTPERACPSPVSAFEICSEYLLLYRCMKSSTMCKGHNVNLLQLRRASTKGQSLLASCELLLRCLPVTDAHESNADIDGLTHTVSLNAKQNIGNLVGKCFYQEQRLVLKTVLHRQTSRPPPNYYAYLEPVSRHTLNVYRHKHKSLGTPLEIQ